MLRRLFLSAAILTLSAFLAAEEPLPEGGVSAIAQDPLQAIRYVGAMGPIGAKALAPATGRDYPLAVRLQTAGPQKHFWDSSIDIRTTSDIAKGDLLLASCDARLVQKPPEDAAPQMMVYFQGQGLGNRKPLRTWVEVRPEWQTLRLAFRARDPYIAGKATLSFGLQAGPMAVEIGNISLVNYRKEVDMKDLPVHRSEYADDAFLRPWLDMAAQWRDKIHETHPKLETDALASLRKTHPRLMLTPEREKWLKDRLAEGKDPDLARLYKQHLDRADDDLDDKPFRAPGKGHNPWLGEARRLMQHVYDLGTAWRFTGERKYFDRLRTDLLEVAALEGWRPHKISYLVIAEMTHALSVGYDWLYHDLSDQDRATLRDTIVCHGVERGIRAYEGDEWFPGADHNWNQVCNFGMIVGALAVGDVVPDKASRVVAYAVDSLPLAMARYAPDGAWTEGPGYWRYTTTYTAFGLTALETALGHDFGLSEMPGFDKTGEFRIHTAGPTLLTLNFADCGKGNRRRASWPLCYLARRYDRPLYAHFEHRQLDRFKPEAQHLAWYVPRPDGEMPALALDRKFDGPVAVAVMRDKWFDREALFVGVKAGYVQVNHGHMDLGNFELDALGVRWSRDLGAESYTLPHYFDRRKKRWTYYLCQSRSHSVPLIDGQDQSKNGIGKIVGYRSQGDRGAWAVVDLSNAYPGRAKKVTRAVRMMPGRKSILVQDEFLLDRPRRLTWAMTTPAEIDIQPQVALLSHEGKQLRATIVAPAGAQFSSESAERQAPLKSNKGFRRLLVECDAPAGSTAIAVHLAPVWLDGPDAPPDAPTPIDAWASH